MSDPKSRPLGDWPTIIGTAFGGLALVVAILAWVFPQSSGEVTAASSGQGSTSESWFGDHVALWLYLGFLSVPAVSWMLFRIRHRPLDGFLPLILGGIAFELFAWGSMSAAWRVASVSTLAVTVIVLLCAIWSDAAMIAMDACFEPPRRERMRFKRDMARIRDKAGNASVEELQQFVLKFPLSATQDPISEESEVRSSKREAPLPSAAADAGRDQSASSATPRGKPGRRTPPGRRRK